MLASFDFAILTDFVNLSRFFVNLDRSCRPWSIPNKYFEFQFLDLEVRGVRRYDRHDNPECCFELKRKRIYEESENDYKEVILEFPDKDTKEQMMKSVLNGIEQSQQLF